MRKSSCLRGMVQALAYTVEDCGWMKLQWRQEDSAAECYSLFSNMEQMLYQAVVRETEGEDGVVMPLTFHDLSL